MRRKRTKRVVESSDSEDDVPLKKLLPTPKNESSTDKQNENDSSSSDSDIENYLQPINRIDLNSSFFNTRSKNEQEFDKIERKLFDGITRLSDSESDDADTIKVENSTQKFKESEVESKPSTSSTKLNFQQLEEYTRQIEEAKKHVDEYNARKMASKKVEENNLDVSNLLALGESKQITIENIKPEDLHSSDFESCDSEQEDWEEVKNKDSQEAKETVPKRDIQIVVNMPDSCRKKKGVDLLAAMKRRLNRIRKENQVYVHKVHLLCWIAHGNYVNDIINNAELLGLALSLLPSEKCYPGDRTDLSYLEQIVRWYRKAMKLTEKPMSKKMELLESLKLEISKKESYNKKAFVYIFVAILRALGIQCRLVLSFQVEPLRPPASELHSLAKDIGKKKTNSNTVDRKEKDKNLDKTKHSKVKAKSQSKNTSLSNPDVSETARSVKSNKTEVEKKFKTDKIDVSGPAKKESKHSKDKAKTENSERNKTETRKILKTDKDDINRHVKKESKINLSSNKDAQKNEKRSNVKEKNLKDILKISESKTRSSKSEGSREDNAPTEKQKPNKKVSQREEPSNGSIKNKFRKKESISKHDLELNKAGNGYSRSEDDNSKKLKAGNKESKSKKDVKSSKKEKTETVPQLDGADSSSNEDTVNCFILQLDGVDDGKGSTSKKPNLKKLRDKEEECKVKKHPSRLKTLEKEYNSEDDFRPRSPFTKKNTDSPKVLQNRKVNLQNLKTSPTRNQNKSEKNLPKKQLDVKNDIINLIKGRIAEQKHIDRSRTVKKRKPPRADSDCDSDSDFMPEPTKKKHHDSDSDIDYFVPKPKVKRRVRPLKQDSSGNKILSSDSDSEKKGKKKGNDVWVEVFLESEEKWISVDVVRGQVHCVNELFTRATHPVSYIVAWNNNNSIKDITKRYCTNFNTITRKLRVDSKWWEETLKPFLGKYTAKDKEEDDDLNRQQLDQPLPKSITEYKNHPLYALRRHLLKFEEIYPPDIQPLGFIRGEPVYPRNCVYVCRSRDIWLKEAKVVKPGEQPYKIVKARPKYDKLSNKVITDQLLEIFGEWQTTDYEPPTAENGIVPRNAFGNVELFKPCMLPKGTVHLKLPGLNKVCRRMDIDCASAIVGFDFHGGWSHPMYDGFVVCEEFADTVVAAWELEQDEIERKENEKIEKRVYGNWRKLIKGLLIRERLKAKYDFGEATTSSEGKEKKPKGPKFCTKKR